APWPPAIAAPDRGTGRPRRGARRHPGCRARDSAAAPVRTRPARARPARRRTPSSLRPPARSWLAARRETRFGAAAEHAGIQPDAGGPPFVGKARQQAAAREPPPVLEAEQLLQLDAAAFQAGDLDNGGGDPASVGQPGLLHDDVDAG